MLFENECSSQVQIKPEWQLIPMIRLYQGTNKKSQIKVENPPFYMHCNIPYNVKIIFIYSHLANDVQSVQKSDNLLNPVLIKKGNQLIQIYFKFFKSSTFLVSQ